MPSRSSSSPIPAFLFRPETTTRQRGTRGSNPGSSSGESVSPVDNGAAREKSRGSAPGPCDATCSREVKNDVDSLPDVVFQYSGRQSCSCPDLRESADDSQ